MMTQINRTAAQPRPTALPAFWLLGRPHLGHVGAWVETSLPQSGHLLTAIPPFPALLLEFLRRRIIGLLRRKENSARKLHSCAHPASRSATEALCLRSVPILVRSRGFAVLTGRILVLHGFAAQRIHPIRPCLHHRPALGRAGRAILDRSHAGLAMRRLPLDDVRRDSLLVQLGARHRPESVRHNAIRSITGRPSAARRAPRRAGRSAVIQQPAEIDRQEAQIHQISQFVVHPLLVSMTPSMFTRRVLNPTSPALITFAIAITRRSCCRDSGSWLMNLTSVTPLPFNPWKTT